MPLVKVNLLKGRSAEEKGSIAASVQTALVSTLEVPDADRYQLITEIGRANVSFGKGLAQRAPTSQLAG
jgi:4-oxalocrotonate tautomerase